MSSTMSASFSTRRDAEMAVEHLVQEFSIERTDIFIAADGRDNTAGETEAGADVKAAEPSTGPRSDAPLHGQIVVSVDVQDDARIADIRSTFTDFEATDITEK